jgi:threonine dehydratase
MSMTAEDVLSAQRRIVAEVRMTPVERSAALSAAAGCTVHLKLEHLQHTGSFKIRGALNKILSLDPAARRAGVLAASTGNHGRAVCHAARVAGTHARIYLPRTVHPQALAAMRELGGELVADFADPLAAELAARADASASGRIFVSPYNDPVVIAGQGTIGVELQRQLESLDAVYIAVGGGGLLAGVGTYLKSVAPAVRVVGCWPRNAPALYECVRANAVIEVPESPTLSTSTAGGVEPGSVTLDLCRRVLDDAVLVSEAEILTAMRRIAESEGWIIEGAAGVAVAGLLQSAPARRGESAVAIVCGRNIALERWRECLDGGRVARS